MSTGYPESAASVTIVAVGYRARCTERGCRNLGRMILRYADAGGRPIRNAEFCHAHARVKVARGRAAGLKVYDNREPSQSGLIYFPATMASKFNAHSVARLSGRFVHRVVFVVG